MYVDILRITIAIILRHSIWKLLDLRGQNGVTAILIEYLGNRSYMTLLITVIYIHSGANLGHVNMSHDFSHTQTRKQTNN